MLTHQTRVLLAAGASVALLAVSLVGGCGTASTTATGALRPSPAPGWLTRQAVRFAEQWGGHSPSMAYWGLLRDPQLGRLTGSGPDDPSHKAYAVILVGDYDHVMLKSPPAVAGMSPPPQPSLKWIYSIYTLRGQAGGSFGGGSTTFDPARFPGLHLFPPDAFPSDVALTLPTTVHAGDGTTGGALLTPPTSKARVSWRRALTLAHEHPKARLTAEVLADVTMPNDYYHGKPIERLTCWVYVFTLPEPTDPRQGFHPTTSSPTPTPAPVRWWHLVIILDARNGESVRGYFAK